MKPLEKNNRLPRSYTYDRLSQALTESFKRDEYEIGLGENTIAYFSDSRVPSPITVEFRGCEIVKVYEKGMVALNDSQLQKGSVKRRMDSALQGIGKRLLSRNGKWKIYDIETGTYDDYWPGVVVMQ